MIVFVIYSQQVEGHGAPFKVFREKEVMSEWLSNNKDSYNCEYCWEEIEVE